MGESETKMCFNRTGRKILLDSKKEIGKRIVRKVILMNENWIKVSEYAKLKNIALHTAYKHIKQGKIQVKKINGIKHVAVQENEKTADEIEAE